MNICKLPKDSEGVDEFGDGNDPVVSRSWYLLAIGNLSGDHCVMQLLGSRKDRSPQSALGAALISCAPATPPGVRVRTVKPLLGFDRIHQVEPDKALRDALQACALHAPALRRVAPEVGHPVHRQVWHVVPMLLDQLTRTLAAENDDKAALSIAISGRSGGDSPAPSETG